MKFFSNGLTISFLLSTFVRESHQSMLGDDEFSQEITFVTGNKIKWAEVQAIVGDKLRLKVAAIDCIDALFLI